LSFADSFMDELMNAASADSEDTEVQSISHIDGGELRVDVDEP